MTTHLEIKEALFDADGSARDITFTPVGREDVVRFLEKIKSDYLVYQASNQEGVDLREQIAKEKLSEIFKLANGSVNSYWKSQDHMIRELQVFIYWPEEEDKFFVELTFFPQDLVSENFELSRFISTVDHWSELLNAVDYFVRYEDASWTQYCGTSPDVIFTKQINPKTEKVASRNPENPIS